MRLQGLCFFLCFRVSRFLLPRIVCEGGNLATLPEGRSPNLVYQRSEKMGLWYEDVHVPSHVSPLDANVWHDHCALGPWYSCSLGMMCRIPFGQKTVNFEGVCTSSLVGHAEIFDIVFGLRNMGSANEVRTPWCMIILLKRTFCDVTPRPQYMPRLLFPHATVPSAPGTSSAMP